MVDISSCLVFLLSISPPWLHRAQSWHQSYRAVEKFDKQQLKRKRFEIYQTISCFEAFLLSFFLNNFPKFVSKSVKLAAVIEIIVVSILTSFCQPQ